jgi:hypothetical protein
VKEITQDPATGEKVSEKSRKQIKSLETKGFFIFSQGIRCINREEASSETISL